jgi:hypothetical protein
MDQFQDPGLLGGQVHGRIIFTEIIQGVLRCQLFLLQPVHQPHDLLKGKGHVQQGVEHLSFPLFNALGDLHFTFPGEQGDGPHFLEVEAHRIVKFSGAIRLQAQISFAFVQVRLGGQGHAGGLGRGYFQVIEDHDVLHLRAQEALGR